MWDLFVIRCTPKTCCATLTSSYCLTRRQGWEYCIRWVRIMVVIDVSGTLSVIDYVVSNTFSSTIVLLNYVWFSVQSWPFLFYLNLYFDEPVNTLATLSPTTKMLKKAGPKARNHSYSYVAIFLLTSKPLSSPTKRSARLVPPQAGLQNRKHCTFFLLCVMRCIWINLFIWIMSAMRWDRHSLSDGSIWMLLDWAASLRKNFCVKY